MKKCSRYIVLAVGIAIVIMLGIVGLKCNENFWEVGIQNCATWLIAILVSFFLVQEKMDERVRKQLLISLLDKIKDLADDSTLWVLPNVSTEAVLSNMRSLGNLIDIFGKCSKQFGIKEEADFVLSEYKEYSEIIGLHINDRNTLDKLSNELRRPLALISQKVFETELKLYK